MRVSPSRTKEERHAYKNPAVAWSEIRNPVQSYAPDACGGGTPSSTTAEVVSRAAPPLRSADCATRTRIANRVEQKKPHLLMQSRGQSASTLCSDNREEIPIASARRQRAAKRGASRQAAAQTRSAEATCSDATGPMSFPGASQPHIQTAAVRSLISLSYLEYNGSYLRRRGC